MLLEHGILWTRLMSNQQGFFSIYRTKGNGDDKEVSKYEVRIEITQGKEEKNK